MYELDLAESLIEAQTDDVVREITVGGLLREIANLYPAAPALVEVGIDGRTARRWSYAELLADSEKLALALASRFEPGERITVWAPNTPEWLLLEYACALAGIVVGVFHSPGVGARRSARPAPPPPRTPVAAEDPGRVVPGRRAPLTGSRKIKKFALREAYLAGEYTSV